ncbi:MAG: hypothetical protein V3T69_09205 [Acidiferrobacterales bacterium]
MGDIARSKYDFDVAGHYARPDVFRLHVNEHPMPAVTQDARVAAASPAPSARTKD